MTRVRLRFPQGDPLEFDLDQVATYGPEIGGFRAWLGAVFASAEGRWVIRFTDERILGFGRDELKRVRVTPQGISVVMGAGEDVVDLNEAEVESYGPEPRDVRSWLGRLAHGSGEAWIRLRDGTQMSFPIGGGPHVTFVG